MVDCIDIYKSLNNNIRTIKIQKCQNLFLTIPKQTNKQTNKQMCKHEVKKLPYL